MRPAFDGLRVIFVHKLSYPAGSVSELPVGKKKSESGPLTVSANHHRPYHRGDQQRQCSQQQGTTQSGTAQAGSGGGLGVGPAQPIDITIEDCINSVV